MCCQESGKACRPQRNSSLPVSIPPGKWQQSLQNVYSGDIDSLFREVDPKASVIHAGWQFPGYRNPCLLQEPSA